MSESDRHDLTRLQRRVLRSIGETHPPWTLTGGGALVGFHLHHRSTRDLDLFWHGTSSLSPVRVQVEDRLRNEGLEVKVIRSGESYHQLVVSDGAEKVVVDLVAEPVSILEAPVQVSIEGVTIQLDTPYEILVNKLCSLLHRSEPRDLFDVKSLVESGVSLESAIQDAPAKDAGFSPATLAWVLRGLPLLELAQRSGLATDIIEGLVSFPDLLVKRLWTSRLQSLDEDVDSRL